MEYIVEKNNKNKSKKQDKPDDKNPSSKPEEVNGPKGLEPTRYGDWERKGIVSDF